MKNNHGKSNSSSSRALLIINDAEVRKAAFASTAAILKKIEQLEKDVDAFHEKDQQLYNEWFNLTFRDELKKAELLREEYFQLGSFHNEVIAFSQMKNIPPYKAYGFLMEEKHQYENGNESERAKIDGLRKERQEFARKAMEEEDRRYSDDHFFSDEDIFSDDDLGFDDSSDEDVDKMFSGKRSRVDLSKLNKSEKEIYNLIKNMPEKEMAGALKSSDGLMMFLQAFSLASAVEDGHLIVKLWDAAPAKVRNQAQKMFPAQQGSLKDIIEGLRFAVQMDDIVGDFEDNNNDDIFEDEDQEENEHHSDEKFVFFGKKGKKSLKPNDEALLKQIYRKLVRVIHPDSHHHDQKMNSQKQQWFSKMWHEIQRAYQGKNLSALKRLEMIAVVRTQDLQSLTLEEISDSAKFFNQELVALKRNIKEFQKNPAWRFSGKKNYESLKSRIKKELREDLEPLYFELEELKELHSFFSRQYSYKGRKKLRKKHGKKTKLVV